MATRVLDEENKVSFNQYQFSLKGQASLNDEFDVVMSESGSGDNRNLLKIIDQQTQDMNGPYSGGFSSIFSNIVAEVGASVSASDEALMVQKLLKKRPLKQRQNFLGLIWTVKRLPLLNFNKPIRLLRVFCQQPESCFRH